MSSRSNNNNNSSKLPWRHETVVLTKEETTAKIGVTSQRLVSINNNKHKVPMDHATILWTREEVQEEIVATMKIPPRTELTVTQEARAKTAPMEKALLSFNGSNQRSSRSRSKIPVRHEAEASLTREVRGEIATMGRSMTKTTATMESARTMTMTATMEDHSINNTKTARGTGNKKDMRPRSKGLTKTKTPDRVVAKTPPPPPQGPWRNNILVLIHQVRMIATATAIMGDRNIGLVLQTLARLETPEDLVN
jgi:hypothetical protein